MTRDARKRSLRRPAERREGAAMLIVMLVLLMATATAIFSVHATSYEIRAAGHSKRAMQTQYVAHSTGVSALQWVSEKQAHLNGLMEQQELASSGTSPLTLQRFHEPDLPPDKEGLRLQMSDLTRLDPHISEAPIDRDALGGDRQVYEPTVYVDIYDKYAWKMDTPGCQGATDSEECDAQHVTVTARGRTRVAVDGLSEETQKYHEGASDTRAHALIRPTAVP